MLIPGLAYFVHTFAAKAADSDYSHYAKLQSTSQYDIRAAAEALLAFATQNELDVFEPTEDMVITALLAQDGYWDDENALVSAEFEDYWDATDALHLSSGLRQQIQDELARDFLSERKDKHIVINNQNGIWLFRKANLWSTGKGA